MGGPNPTKIIQPRAAEDSRSRPDYTARPHQLALQVCCTGAIVNGGHSLTGMASLRTAQSFAGHSVYQADKEACSNGR